MQGLPLVQVKNVSKSFAGVRALNDVSFSIYPGERLTLVGENGSGNPPSSKSSRESNRMMKARF